MTTPEISNVMVEIADGTSDRACVSWEAEGFRWHVWMRQGGPVEGGVGRQKPTLYKSSKAKPGEPGHYIGARRLDALTKDGNMRPMVGAALDFVRERGLMLRALERRRRADEAKMRETEAEARDRRKRDAAPDMYDALAAVRDVTADWANDPVRNWVHRQVEAALAKAEGRA
jgi:hypothetical protein